MKAHIGVDVASAVVHTLTGTAANDADINQAAAVLHGREAAVFADAGYTGADKRPELEDRDVSWNILCSQPTMTRLENLPGPVALKRMMAAMVELFCDSFDTVPRRIVLDIDDTEDRAYGGQQLWLFNAHHDSHCFMPIHIYEAISAKPVRGLPAAGQDARWHGGLPGAAPRRACDPRPLAARRYPARSRIFAGTRCKDTGSTGPLTSEPLVPRATTCQWPGTM